MNITGQWPVRCAILALITAALMTPTITHATDNTPVPTATFVDQEPADTTPDTEATLLQTPGLRPASVNLPDEGTPQSTSLRDLAQWVEHPSDDEEQRAAPSRVGIGKPLEEGEQYVEGEQGPSFTNVMHPNLDQKQRCVSTFTSVATAEETDEGEARYVQTKEDYLREYCRGSIAPEATHSTTSPSAPAQFAVMADPHTEITLVACVLTHPEEVRGGAEHCEEPQNLITPGGKSATVTTVQQEDPRTVSGHFEATVDGVTTVGKTALEDGLASLTLPAMSVGQRWVEMVFVPDNSSLPQTSLHVLVTVDDLADGSSPANSPALLISLSVLFGLGVVAVAWIYFSPRLRRIG